MDEPVKGWGTSPVVGITDGVLVVKGKKLHVNKVSFLVFFVFPS